MCVTCSHPDDLHVLSVAIPAGFTGWLYPHPDHDHHVVVTLTPAGARDDTVPGPIPSTAPTQSLRHGPPPGYGSKPIAHGTIGGYSTHLRRGETPCDECKAATARYKAARAAEQRAARAADRSVAAS